MVLLMIPFCWVVFHYEDFSFREGHIVWIFGMVLTLFSPGIGSRNRGINKTH